MSPARLISPVLTALVFASMSHFTFLIKKRGNVFKQREEEVCGTLLCC